MCAPISIQLLCHAFIPGFAVAFLRDFNTLPRLDQFILKKSQFITVTLLPLRKKWKIYISVESQKSNVMFSQWLFVICTLLFVSTPGNAGGASTSRNPQEICKAVRVVQADNLYGWQVSGSSVSSYEVPAN